MTGRDKEKKKKAGKMVRESANPTTRCLGEADHLKKARYGPVTQEQTPNQSSRMSTHMEPLPPIGLYKQLVSH